jgi:hypothetical protein
MEYLSVPITLYTPIAQRLVELKCEWLGVTAEEVTRGRDIARLAITPFSEWVALGESGAPPRAALRARPEACCQPEAASVSVRPMLLDKQTSDGIAEGRIRVVFRTWKKPSVKSGGTLRTRIGVLAIEAVEPITPRQISTRDVADAGFASRSELLSELEGRSGTLYRIRVRLAGADPRIALRQTLPSAAELAELRTRLQRMGAWTREYLELIRTRPAQRAPELAQLMGLETAPFKQRVRKLKELGLTESLEVGYRLSPRGLAYLDAP